MIIIGMLAAIAIPLFLTQKEKATARYQDRPAQRGRRRRVWAVDHNGNYPTDPDRHGRSGGGGAQLGPDWLQALGRHCSLDCTTCLPARRDFCINGDIVGAAATGTTGTKQPARFTSRRGRLRLIWPLA